MIRMVMQRTLTVTEFLALPEAKPGLEYYHGRVEQKPVTNADHIKIVWRLSAAFFAYAQEHGGTGGPEGSVAVESDGGTDVLLPDFGFWAAGVEVGHYPLNPPTLAIEVRSPSQTVKDQQDKCDVYIAGGVREAWVVDPPSRSIWVCDEASAWRRIVGEGALVASSALPGLQVSLDAIFA